LEQDAISKRFISFRDLQKCGTRCHSDKQASSMRIIGCGDTRDVPLKKKDKREVALVIMSTKSKSSHYSNNFVSMKA
jgi:hypothetical protein